ncbi:polysaccharide deacetylase [Natrialba sp. PRR66]|uniref:polysaccharide deacetylase n=1 Tax=Natrialba sp. PRR66 TaxID=3098146 RepID=UPI002B1D980A|nr:polysaccharide deacetylase [Natrialba sp. PRR66]
MGSVLISIDAELAWGFHDLDQPPVERVQNARWGWRRLLELLDAYEVPATWGVVGHLLLERCDGRHAGHPAARDGWFDRDPGGRATTHDHWFGMDLVNAVRDADVEHELGCHSFSHACFDPEVTDRAVAEAELAACLTAARDRGLSFDSFLFPRNDIGYTELLAEYGFSCYRGRSPAQWYDRPWLYPIGKFASYTAGMTPPPLVTPEVDENGIVNVPGSLCLFSFEGLARSIVEPVVGDPVVRKAALGIDAAAAGDGICHLWLHPNDLTTPRRVARLRRILEIIDERRRESDLRVETMRAVARRTKRRAADGYRSEPALEAAKPERSVQRIR